MKKLLKVIAWIFVALLVILLAHPLWVGPLVRGAAPKLVNSATGVAFKVERFALNLYTGHFELGLLELGNPAEFQEPRALAVGRLTVDFDTLSALGSTIRIRSVDIGEVFASYVEQAGTNNWQRIAGGGGASEAKEPQAADQPAEAKASGKKVVIDELTVDGVKVRYGKVVLPLPIKLVLKDLGKDSGGASFAEIGESIWQALLKAVGVVGNGLELLGSASGRLGDGAAALGDSGQQLLDKGAKSLDKGVKFLEGKLKLK